MPHQKIITDIKNNNIAPVYLLAGEEPYYIDMVSDYIEKNILDESEKAFNLDIFYGLEVDPDKVISVCKEFPMMAERRIVIIKEAQKVKDLALFDNYILNPSPTTVLVIAKKAKSFDQRRKVYNPKSNKNIVVLNTKSVPEYKLADWIQNYTKSLGYSIDFQNAQLLSEHLGSDLSKVVKELEKLFISVKKGSSISSDDIEQNIGISKDFNIFELQKAIGFKNHDKAFQIMIYFSENPKAHPIQMTTASLNSYFTKLMLYYYSPDRSDNGLAKAMGVSPYFLKEYRTAARNYPAKKVVNIIKLLREYDLKSKGYEAGSSGQNDWHKELLFKILT
jgi:DNA polymerase-3 subunit delta